MHFYVLFNKVDSINLNCYFLFNDKNMLVIWIIRLKICETLSVRVSKFAIERIQYDDGACSNIAKKGTDSSSKKKKKKKIDQYTAVHIFGIWQRL